MKNIRIVLAGAAAVVLIFVILNSLNNKNENRETEPTSLDSQLNEEGAVAVQVTPYRDQADKSRWSFEVVLDTHSVELNEDLVQATVLLDSNGKEYKPTAWDGDLAQGHHRKGILRFNSVWPLTTLIELKMRGVGGVPERNFRWSL